MIERIRAHTGGDSLLEKCDRTRCVASLGTAPSRVSDKLKLTDKIKK